MDEGLDSLPNTAVDEGLGSLPNTAVDEGLDSRPTTAGDEGLVSLLTKGSDEGLDSLPNTGVEEWLVSPPTPGVDEGLGSLRNTPPPLVGGGWGEGAVPAVASSPLPNNDSPLPPTPSHEGWGRTGKQPAFLHMTGFTHFDAAGNAAMVDVTAKPVTDRTATAQARVAMQPATLAMIQAGTAKKGDVLGVARLAGIMAAKRTAELIPLCHPLPITAVTVDLAPDPATTSVEITATVRTTGQTGVEMEALTAASVAALTVYDMCKAVDRSMRIESLRVTHKAGGKSGEFTQT